MAATRTRIPSRLWWILAAVVVAGILTAVYVMTRGPVTVEGTVATEEPVTFELTSARCGASEVISAIGDVVNPEDGMSCVVRLNLRNLEERGTRWSPRAST